MRFLQRTIEGTDATNSLGAIPPQSNDGTKITGAAIDRLGFGAGKLMFEAAAATGTPTSVTAAISITQSDTLAGDYTDFIDIETALDIKTAVATAYDINLAGAKRYLKVVVDSTYEDGTTPANVLAAKLVLGDSDSNPADTTEVLG